MKERLKNFILTGIIFTNMVLVNYAIAGVANTVNKLTLEEAIVLALKQNPDISEMESRIAEAEARLKASGSGSMPILKARAVYDYWSDNQRFQPASGNNEPGAFGDQIAGVEFIANQLLYTGGRISSDKKAAEWNLKASDDQTNRVRETIVYQVTALFYELLARKDELEAFETAVRAMDEQKRTVEALVQAQKTAGVDLLRVNVRRAELYERLVSNKNNLKSRERAWGVLMGSEDLIAPEAKGSLQLNEAFACPGIPECEKKAMSQRSDYRALKALVTAAEASLQSAHSGYKPVLAVQASYANRFLQNISDQPPGTDDKTDVWKIGLAVEMPIFDGHLTTAKIEELSARLKGLRDNQRKMELQIRYEIESALSDISTATERVKTTEQIVEQAGESFRIMKEKYNLGKVPMTDVLDAQTALVTAQTSRVRALADLRVSDARLKLALGEILS